MTDPATPAPIASPIPLTTPEGRLLAYACPQCEQGYASVLGESPKERLATSRQDADQCCRCIDCGVVTSWEVYCCPRCNAKGYLALGWIQFRKERQ